MGTATHKKSKHLLPALAAVGSACGLATIPASALELGEIRVDSTLGQPLRASIAYALAPNEQMFNFCVFLKPGTTASRIPAFGDARVTVTDNAIVLSGRMPIREPLLTLQVSVRCPYTANLARDYTLMIDPPLASEGERAALSTERPPMTPIQTATVTASDIPYASVTPVAVKPTPRRPTRRPKDETPIAASSRYLVQPGDSLSEIVSRIENRNMPLWPAVNAIFAANPHAFLNNDPNLLKSGSWLDIPDLRDGAAVTTLVAGRPAAQPVTPGTTAYSGVTPAVTAAQASAPAEPTTVESQPLPQSAALPQPAPAATAERLAEPQPAVETVAETGLPGETADEPLRVDETSEEPVTKTPQLRPGDFVIGTDNPFVVPLGSEDVVIDIPDSELRGPQLTQPVPTVAVTGDDQGDISTGWAWFLWLGGAGVAMILGLFLFGRRLREYFGSVPIAVPIVPQRRRDDHRSPRTIADLDYNFDATTITGRKISLDADLHDGTGLQDSDDLDVAQDFAFSATESQIDVDIPEITAEEVELSLTDVIPQQEPAEETILESEVLHTGDDSDDEGDYSVSMIVDATRQILDDSSATTKDLQAVLVDSSGDVSGEITAEYSLSRSAEYQILEQDYEEELTATQALNKEIEEAARALAEQMEAADSGDDTESMPASMDPDMTAELTANLKTQGDAQNDDYASSGKIPDLLVDMPEGDETLEVESPRIESEKKEASSG